MRYRFEASLLLNMPVIEKNYKCQTGAEQYQRILKNLET